MVIILSYDNNNSIGIDSTSKKDIFSSKPKERWNHMKSQGLLIESFAAKHLWSHFAKYYSEHYFSQQCGVNTHTQKKKFNTVTH